MKLVKILVHLLFILLLTMLTQVGGLLWLLALFISARFKKKKRYLFPILYLIFNILIIPPIAKSFGREALPVFNSELRSKNIVYPLLFRNYVKPRLKVELEHALHVLYKSDIRITYLDANFPFFDGFPLLPHLSHNDGKKVDISFMYLDENGNSTNKKPSVSGYGAYVVDHMETSENCLNNGYWQYDFPKYLTFGTINDLELDRNKTKALILQLLASPKTEKIFIEPYLKERLGLSSENKIRFHGCQAVRHDDHIHLQIK
ncbi:hypothetical protein [Seonamhaeicola sp.]|uniref:hypothetical protein n=1 Tax=Seonamhaeicola sp. TaxID=1912245 RepID=UPI002603CBA1|nr:hypothetical protein [Seonamhaeicola sp.]